MQLFAMYDISDLLMTCDLGRRNWLWEWCQTSNYSALLFFNDSMVACLSVVLWSMCCTSTVYSLREWPFRILIIFNHSKGKEPYCIPNSIFGHPSAMVIWIHYQSDLPIALLQMCSDLWSPYQNLGWCMLFVSISWQCYSNLYIKATHPM